MISEQSKSNLPFDEQNYIMVGYPDHFISSQNKKIHVKNLGEIFAGINSFFYEYLKEYHIPCAFIKNHNKNSLVFLKFKQLPFFIKILNAADKRTSKIFSIKEGKPLELPVFEYHYGNYRDSVVSESHLISFDLCSNEDLKLISRISSKINAVIKAFFERRNEMVAEIVCSFGKYEGKLYLIDDFSPLSLKVFPNGNANKWSNPYQLHTSSEMRRYSNFLFDITNS